MAAEYETEYEPEYEAGEALADIDVEAADEELTPEQAAFAQIAQQAEAGLAACDEAYVRIQNILAEYDEAKRQEAEDVINNAIENDVNSEPALAEQWDFESQYANAPAPPNLEAIQRDAFVQTRLREARRAAANASWQLLLGFGISFAVRVGLLGICLGGWIDRHWLGGTGFGAMGIILLVIGYSFYMLYADLCRSDERWRQERQRLQAEAEREFDSRLGCK